MSFALVVRTTDCGVCLAQPEVPCRRTRPKKPKDKWLHLAFHRSNFFVASFLSLHWGQYLRTYVCTYVGAANMPISSNGTYVRVHSHMDRVWSGVRHALHTTLHTIEREHTTLLCHAD